MDLLNNFVTGIADLGLHRYGLIFFTVLLAIPALVAGNMLQFLLTRIARGETSLRKIYRPLLANFLVFSAFLIVLSATVLEYSA